MFENVIIKLVYTLPIYCALPFNGYLSMRGSGTMLDLNSHNI